MNKLLGFYELKHSGLPCVDWKEFKPDMKFDSNILWTIRTAIEQGNDFNLPRKVGVDSEEAYNSSMDFYNKLNGKGMVVTYPYFIAAKSGNLEVSTERVVIEAVNEDLWNLVTENKKDVTIIQTINSTLIDGNKDFLSKEEQNILMCQAKRVKGIFRSKLAEGKSVLLEWSFAYNTDKNKNRIGDMYLVFFEARTI